jgi:hypothetical protein
VIISHHSCACACGRRTRPLPPVPALAACLPSADHAPREKAPPPVVELVDCSVGCPSRAKEKSLRESRTGGAIPGTTRGITDHTPLVLRTSTSRSCLDSREHLATPGAGDGTAPWKVPGRAGLVSLRACLTGAPAHRCWPAAHPLQCDRDGWLTSVPARQLTSVLTAG